MGPLDSGGSVLRAPIGFMVLDGFFTGGPYSMPRASIVEGLPSELTDLWF